MVLTMGSREALPAFTVVRVDAIHARAIVHARGRGAILIIDFTVSAGKTQWALASVRVNVVVASGTILTGIGATFIQIVLTSVSSKSIHAKTSVVANMIQTGAPIETRPGSTVVGVFGAFPPFVAQGTLAAVGTVRVMASGSIFAR